MIFRSKNNSVITKKKNSKYLQHKYSAGIIRRPFITDKLFLKNQLFANNISIIEQKK